MQIAQSATAQETSVDSCGPAQSTHSVLRDSGSQTVGNLETSVTEKGKTSAVMWPRASTDKCDTSAELCGPERHIVLRGSVGQVGDKGSKFRFRP